MYIKQLEIFFFKLQGSDNRRVSNSKNPLLLIKGKYKVGRNNQIVLKVNIFNYI